MRKAGHLAASCLDHLAPLVQQGVTTRALDDAAREFILDHSALPATMGYRGYKHSLCTSINHVVCHGIPGEKPLKDGDILNIDVTVIVDGWHGDTSRMYVAGTPNRRAERLMDVTYEALMQGLAQVKPGNTTGDIGHAIQAFAEGERMSIVEDFCGHGPRPAVSRRAEHPALRPPRRGRRIAAKACFFTVEPMVKPRTTRGENPVGRLDPP